MIICKKEQSDEFQPPNLEKFANKITIYFENFKKRAKSSNEKLNFSAK